jgi:UDP-N-acetylmuramyl pentapeptide phosphotransferase/UDP-N-acetylglucosamine-1-phosphate transferase
MIALLISYLTQKAVIFYSHKHTLFIDHHEDDKPQNFHDVPTPRAGGIGIFLATLLIYFTTLNPILLIPIFLAFLSGIVEDFHGTLSPVQRLILQLIAALSAIILVNAVVTYLGLGIKMPYIIGIAFSAFAIVGAINAVNIIDGFNGLAAFVSLHILLAFSIIAYTVGDFKILYLTIATIGGIIGFLLLNYPKGEIFLGDGGAYMLGFICALSGIYLASNYSLVSPWFVLCMLIYPVFEVLFSIYRKKSRGMSPMEPDRVHFHMLINKRITRNNPKTTRFILAVILPFIYIPIFYFNSSIYNIITIFIFIAVYLSIYFLSVQFKIQKVLDKLSI